MTDHNSPAGAVGGGQPSGQPGSFGPSQQPQQQQPQQQPPQGHQQPWQGQGQQAPAPQQPAAPQASHPQQLPSDAARAQVAAAWVRNAPRAGQAAVPSLPPRETRPQGESKKEKRERERAERKAAYEQKKAEKEQRKRGGAATPTATAPTPTAAVTAPTPTPTPAAVPAQAASHPAPRHTHQAATTSSPATPAATAQRRPTGGSTPASAPSRSAGGFDVPKPGGRISGGGRRTHVALRATLLITTCVLALGSCGVMGLVVGKSSGATASGLDASDAARYRLTEFPTEQAAAFAEQYAQLCMTFSPDTSSTRRTELARYISAGVDPECGWSGEGAAKAVSATWDGTAETLPEFGDHGRYIGVQVRTDDGTLTTLTVPVYVKNLKTGEGMRVAGDVGQMPMPAAADVPEVDQRDEVVDDALSTQLQQKVLPGYFEAWGASDATAMARFITPDATLTATTGLAGRLTTPQVGAVVALVPPSVQDTKPYSYDAGQVVQVRAAVDWSDPKGVVVRRAYRMTMVNTAQGWFIKDVRGGVLDAEGGRADGDAGGGSATATPSPATTPSGAPSTAASPSAAPKPSTGKQPGKP